jgi:hypothetical protein
MLFISYWELNADFDPSELADIAQMLLSKNLYPVEGVNQIGWYVSASDFWGVSISEADSEEAMLRGTNLWRIAKPGIFKSIKTTPAMELANTIPLLVKLKEEIKS